MSDLVSDSHLQHHESPSGFFPKPMPQAVDIPVLTSVLLMGVGGVVGVIVALALAWFMSFLINTSELTLEASERIHMLDFVRVKREEVAERKDRKPERPQPQEVPDTPPTPQESQSADTSTALAVTAPVTAAEDLGLGRSGIDMGAGDGDYLPIVKVAPIYPRRALARGMTGTCTVKYTVTTSGTVRDVEVVPEMCSDEIFSRPSVEAAKRFRYKPRVIDGVAVEVAGIYNKFYFEGKQAGDDDG
jgi:protein TonB